MICLGNNDYYFEWFCRFRFKLKILFLSFQRKTMTSQKVFGKQISQEGFLLEEGEVESRKKLFFKQSRSMVPESQKIGGMEKFKKRT